MGALLDAYGWTAWGPSMIAFAAIGTILMMPLWNVTPVRRITAPAPAAETAVESAR
jgi:OPA family glycerol-3-phosphate transporter-like MFS transporter